MTSQTVYYYNEDGKIKKSDKIPQGVEEYTEKKLLIADEGKALTNGRAIVSRTTCAEKDVKKWKEIDAPQAEEDEENV